MLKKNNKGFMLMETLLVSVFLASTLIFLYIQFQKVRDSYQSSFTYDTVINTYASSNFLKYIQENGIKNLSKTIDSGTVYIDLTDCPSGYLTNTPLCQKLIKDLGIKKVIYSSSDTTNLITRMNNSSDFSPKFREFIKNIKVTNRISYRLSIEYNDETYSTVLARSNTVSEPQPPKEILMESMCSGGHPGLIWANNCELMAPSTSVNQDFSYSNSIGVSITGNFKAGTTYKVVVTNYSGEYLPGMSGNIITAGVEFPGEWVIEGNKCIFTFTPTELTYSIVLGKWGSYVSAGNISGMARIISVEIYEIS